MKKLYLTLPLLVILSLTLCSWKRNNGTKVQEKPVIRYINLNSIYTTVSNMEPEFRGTGERRKSLLLDIDKFQEQILTLKTGSESLYIQLKQKKDELEKLDLKIRLLKVKIYSRINNALKKISGRGNIDFIFNIGTGLVYSSKKYEITEDVIREIISQEKRSAPVNR